METEGMAYPQLVKKNTTFPKMLAIASNFTTLHVYDDLKFFLKRSCCIQLERTD